ncbi:acyl CoA binding protein-domain-containing protein [Amylostereum chailletii]|nr:acyl CoA binding protein-domain-containing protein [Amylostereum chailletii]
MDSRELIDAQFDRAVEIIQSLPKTGPIQTGYEEKLTMYSLYKQATVGNVKSPRPGIFDMLGRAKWDAWAKHKDLDPYEAKWLYVDALLKVLRRYSDKTVARDLVRELEAYEGDPANIMMSGSLPRSPGSDSSDSEQEASASVYRSAHLAPHSRANTHPQGQPMEESTSEEESDEDQAPLPPMPVLHPHDQGLTTRPQSSLSSHRYRTPAAGSMTMAPGMIPTQQPHPGFETPSAFAGPSTSPIPSSSYPVTGPYAPYTNAPTSPPLYPGQAAYRRPPSSLAARTHALHDTRPPSHLALERAVEGVQAHLAALSERLEVLESHSLLTSGGYVSPGPRTSASPTYGRGSPHGRAGETWRDLTFDDMGLWTYVLRAVARASHSLRGVMEFLAHSDNRSPTLIIIRRLFLDISFILCLLALFKSIRRRTGVRRREVATALRALWSAVMGKSTPRALVDQGV